MRLKTIIFCIIWLCHSSLGFQSEQELKEFLDNVYNPNATELCTTNNMVEWAFATDVNNKEKEKQVLDVTLKNGKVVKYYWEKYFKNLKESDYSSETVQREIKFLRIVGSAALQPEKLEKLTSINTNLTNIYSAAKICPFKKQNCNLEKEGMPLSPDIEDVMAQSTDYDELLYVWKAWRDATGAKMKQQYNTYVDLSNEAAKANGFPDNSEMWKYDFESPTFEEDMENLWQQVKPLYVQLHKYVSTKLKERYGDKIDLSDGLIPAHVLGNMWAQTWANLLDLLQPYHNVNSGNATASLLEQNYTVLKMFETANDFYLSLGLEDCAISYNTSAGAVLEKPADRDITCHASAWDFCDKQNYRIKMCTKINLEDFITIHHEMGHIQYFLLYKNQPYIFRSGANPGFHEAVGDTIALSASTPKHLNKIGLLSDYSDSNEYDVNALMLMALERVAFLPFGYLIDKWRWDVFSGKVAPEKYNTHWWEFRKNIQMIKPPVDRSDETDFDPGAKYHVAADSQYISYFVAHILEFQLYRGLCKTSGQYDPSDPTKPLHRCDFYNSKEAGQKLRDGLSLGSSKHWKEALKAMTGETDLDATAILEYFKPLLDFLKEKNKLPESDVQSLLQGEYEEKMSAAQQKLYFANWETEVDLGNKEKETAELQVTLELANVTKYYWTKYFRYLDPKLYKNDGIRRQLEKLEKLGDPVLGNEKLSEFTNTTMQMTSIYGQAKVCPYHKRNCDEATEGISLEPDIVNLFANSSNRHELEYLWVAWRNATGPKMKEIYKDYVKLSNSAAKANGYADRGEMWRENFESPTFEEDMDKLWEQVEPLYASLHKYALMKLKMRYRELDFSDGLIPAHILGDVWAQSWSALAAYLKPYPNSSKLDVTKALVSQGYTPLKMFQTADEFYQSLGLEPCTMSYDVSKGAIIEKPKDKEIVCHASAWDFYDKKNFRIKMCTKVTDEDFVTIHHEMGHIQYYILYKDQPIIFKDGANPGFHEAVGDTIALSVSSVKHLRRIGLVKDYLETKEADLNALMNMALDKVAFLPFGYLIDKWRWDVFNQSTNITSDKWNSHWWYYREKIQRVKAPVTRSDVRDFDPGSKFHVANGDYYISYFIANILQFQLYRGLCRIAGEYEPHNKAKLLHKCDYYKSLEAGEKLRAGLSLGSSKHWKDVLEAITGERDYDASAIIEYFQPLKDYLDRITDEMDERSSTHTLPIILACLVGILLLIGILYFIIKRLKSRQTN